jgi:Zn-dependent protease with chaperone function
MRLPLELIIVLIVAKLVYQPGTAKAISSLPELGPNQIAWAFVWLALATTFVYLLSLAGSAVSSLRLKRNPDDGGRIYDAHGRLLVAERALLVAVYMVFMQYTGWSNVVYNPAGLNAHWTVICDDLLLILPFLLGSLAIGLGNYPASRKLAPGECGVWEYLRGQARGLFFLLGPWMIMNGFMDSEIYWPEAVKALYAENGWVQLAGHLLLLASMLAFFPFYMIRLWPHGRLPDGAVRERMERLLKRAGVRCRELMMWHTGRGRMSNAAVMGFVPWSRYIVFTDALLEDLDDNETEAVLAHELGHVRHYHMGFYFVFFAVFVLLTLVFVSFLPVPVVSNPWLTVIMVVGLLVLYGRVFFGFLSRRFEREADVVSCELVGSPLPLMSALEKLARASGGSRTANNWRHYSVAQRVAFLARFGFDREVLKEYHSSVRLIKGGSVLLAALLCGLLFLQSGGKEYLKYGHRWLEEMQLEQHLKRNDHDYESWNKLGEVRRDMRRYDEAWEAYGRAIKIKASDPEAYFLRAQLCWKQDWGGRSWPKAVEWSEKAVGKLTGSVRIDTPSKDARRRLASYLAMLAEARFENGQPAEARKQMQEALKNLPGDPGLKEMLAKYDRALAREKKPGDKQ